MLELTPLVGPNSGHANLSDEGNSNASPWKKLLLFVGMMGLIGVAATQMPKMGLSSSSSIGSTTSSMNVKSAAMMKEAHLIRNDMTDKCGPTAVSLTPAHTFVAGRVIGCSGPFTGCLFDPSAETLCDAVNGWRVCKDQNDAKAQGLDLTKCKAGPAKLFFATQQRGLGYHKCEGSGANDVFGCGGKDLGLSGVDAGTCSPLAYTGGNLFKLYNGKQWSCAACNGNGLNELEKISHQLNGAASYDGGVMCCKSDDHIDKCGPTAASATPAHVFVKGRVIGCDGPITGGLFSDSAKTLCDALSGWRVCRSQNDAKSRGLTDALCKAAPSNKFFATQQTGKRFEGKCDGTDKSLVFGCGGKSLGFVAADPTTCGPLQRTSGFFFMTYTGKQWTCGEGLCNPIGLYILDEINHWLNGATEYDGGVMCCKSGSI